MRKKKENIFYSILITSTYVAFATAFIIIVFGSIRIINSIKINFINDNAFFIILLIYFFINLAVILIIHIFAKTEICNISTYDFIFSDYNSFDDHLAKQLLSNNYTKKNLDNNFIIYRRKKNILEIVINCYILDLNLVNFEKTIKKIEQYIYDSGDNISLIFKGLQITCIINTKNIVELKKIMTSKMIHMYSSRNAHLIEALIIIDQKKKKLYVCDEEKHIIKIQNELAKNILSYIYKDYIGKQNEQK